MKLSIWAFLVAQMIKSLSAIQETQVGSLGQEDPPEKGMATHSSILAWGIPNSVHWDCKESDTTDQLSLFQRDKIKELMK